MKFTPILISSLLSVASIQAEDAKKADAPAATATATEIKHADAKEAKALLDANAKAAADNKEAKIVVVDVRTEDEYKEGHIAGSKNIDINRAGFEEKLAELDKTKPILVHCAAGGRSTKSLETFKKLGFKTVTHLDGGFKDWKKAGNPVEK